MTKEPQHLVLARPIINRTIFRLQELCQELQEISADLVLEEEDNVMPDYRDFDFSSDGDTTEDDDVVCDNAPSTPQVPLSFVVPPTPQVPPSPQVPGEVLGPSAINWINSDEKLPGGKRHRRRRGKKSRRRRPGVPVTINRSVFYAPPRMRTHLTFNLRFTAPAATLLSPWSLEYIVLTNPNIFTGVSTPVPGYTELAGLYRKYRVRSGSLLYSMQNNEAFGVEMFSCPVNFLPSLTTDPTRYLSMGGAKTRLISPKTGMDHGTVRTNASIARFGGSANTTVEDAYVGTSDNSSPPADNLYFIYGFMTNGLATVSPALNVITVSVTIDFFELQSPST